jgi:hypothetical protein
MPWEDRQKSDIQNGRSETFFQYKNDTFAKSPKNFEALGSFFLNVYICQLRAKSVTHDDWDTLISSESYNLFACFGQSTAWSSQNDK